MGQRYNYFGKLQLFLPRILALNTNYQLKPKVPASIISRLVDKTWQTFGIFVVVFFVLSILYNNLMLNDALSLDSMQTYFQNRIEPVRIILLMMGMAVTINGYIGANGSYSG